MVEFFKKIYILSGFIFWSQKTWESEKATIVGANRHAHTQHLNHTVSTPMWNTVEDVLSLKKTGDVAPLSWNFILSRWFCLPSPKTQAFHEVVVYEPIKQVHLKQLSKYQKRKVEKNVGEMLQNPTRTSFYNICHSDD